MTLRQKLKFARKQAGLSKEQAAKLLNLRKIEIFQIESGIQFVSESEMIEFAKIYKVSLDWLKGKQIILPEVIQAYIDKSNPESREKLSLYMQMLSEEQ